MQEDRHVQRSSTAVVKQKGSGKMVIEERESVAAGAGGAQTATHEEAPAKRRRDDYAEAQAREGMQLELNRTEIIEQLRQRLQRDDAYLARRRRKGLHTSTDDALASDLHVFALAISYLEERGEERSSAHRAPHGSRGSHCMLP